MSLSDGDPAQPGDIWFRIATQASYLRKGKVHHAAFGGAAISTPAGEKQRPWDKEVSGRLRSVAGSLSNIEQAAFQFCEIETARGGGKKEFLGIMYARVANLDCTFDNRIKANVHYTPRTINPRDQAHADLAFYGWHNLDDSKEGRERFTIWLSDLLMPLHYPGQLKLLPEPELPESDLPSPETSVEKRRGLADKLLEFIRSFLRYSE